MDSKNNKKEDLEISLKEYISEEHKKYINIIKFQTKV